MLRRSIQKPRPRRIIGFSISPNSASNKWARTHTARATGCEFAERSLREINEHPAKSRPGLPAFALPQGENLSTRWREGQARSTKRTVESGQRSIESNRSCRYFMTAAPAWAVRPSWSLLPPDAPTAPMSLLSMMIGMPPSTGIAPVRRRMRRPSPPPATVS